MADHSICLHDLYDIAAAGEANADPPAVGEFCDLYGPKIEKFFKDRP